MSYQPVRYLCFNQTLDDTIWNSGTCQTANLPTSDVANDIDGGSPLRTFTWTKGQTGFEICSIYVYHVKKKFLFRSKQKFA